MANQVKLANVNISLQQFQKMSSGTYNAGEVRLTSETTLGKLNNHVIFTGWNGKSISHTEVLAIKEAFVRALSDNGVGQAAIDQVRRELGLAPDGAVDVSLRERSIKPLSRKQIRDILDRNAEAINGLAQEHGIRGIRTGEQMRARLSEQEKTARDATRDTVNAALAGSRQIAEHRQIAVIEAVLSGDVDFLSTEDKRAALELAEKQLNTMLTNRKGTLSDTLTSDWSITMTSGQKITMTTGLAETAFRAKLEDIIVRLRTGSSPRNCDLEVRAQFAALADAPARLAFVTDLANDPAGACKARIVVVRLLQGRGIADYATLSVANKLDKHEALALASRLIGLDANVKGDERNAEVAANNGAIANKVAEFCGDVHPAQLSSVYFALSQAAASPVKDGFLNLGIKSDEHTALTYTLSKNAETGAITVTYSEPQGFPFHFHWTATITIDGTTTTTPIMVERQ